MPKKHHAHEGEAHHAAHHAEKSKSIGSLLGSQQAGTIILFLLIGLVVGLALGYMLTSSGQQQGGAQAAMPTQDALKVKLASYLNTNFFSTQGMEAKVKDFNNFDDMFYGFSFDITQDGNVQQTVSDVFVSKDGKMLVVGTPYEKAAFSGQVYLLDVPFPAPQQSEEPTQPAVYPQSDKPEVLLFVWAFCPGGVSGESALKPVVDLLGDNINAKVTFIGAVTSNAAAAANSCFAGRGLSQAEALANCCVKYDNIEGQTVYSCALHNTVGNLQ
ncbi:MAG: hypothetical protein NTW59_00215, partial [Candidatus Diapherotrites archaeon]|nr:hypothetical protein [Candidatus Diapherotrites archaeon]